MKSEDFKTKCWKVFVNFIWTSFSVSLFSWTGKRPPKITSPKKYVELRVFNQSFVDHLDLFSSPLSSTTRPKKTWYPRPCRGKPSHIGEKEKEGDGEKRQLHQGHQEHEGHLGMVLKNRHRVVVYYVKMMMRDLDNGGEDLGHQAGDHFSFLWCHPPPSQPALQRTL